MSFRYKFYERKRVSPGFCQVKANVELKNSDPCSKKKELRRYVITDPDTGISPHDIISLTIHAHRDILVLNQTF